MSKITDPKIAALLQRAQASRLSYGGRPDSYTPAELSQILGVKTDTLQKWRSQGRGPPFSVLGPRTVIYLRKSVLQWLRENENTATEAYRPRASRSSPAPDDSP